MNPRIIIFPHLDILSLAAANQFSEAAQAAVSQRGQALVVLSGGSTPRNLFEHLASTPFAEQVPWTAVHFFWADERCVPPEHPESNFRQANQMLFQPLHIPTSNLHRIQGEMAPEQAARTYAQTLRQYAAPGENWPVFDLVLLGLGADGHTASLFPGRRHPAGAPVLAVTASYQDRPARRVTLTPVVFNTAHQVLFLVAGEDKADAVRRTLCTPVDAIQNPAQAISLDHGMLQWFLDEGAAQKLDSRFTHPGSE